jgi:hypothetical protein
MFCSPPGVSNSARGNKFLSAHESYSLPPLCFFITFYFYIDIDNAPLATRLLYNDLERRMQGNSLLLTISPIFCLTMTNFCLLHQWSFFTWNIEWNGNGYRLSDIGTEWTRTFSDWTQWITKNSQCFPGCTHFSIIDSLATVLSKHLQTLACSV